MTVVTAVQILKISDSSTTDVEDPGQANPDANFRFDTSLGGTGGYIFNLRTTGLSMGTYVVVFQAAGDPTLHATELTFQVR